MTVITIQLPGSPGSPGPQGVPGPAGPSASLTIGTVTTLGAGASASATITGTSPNQVLNLSVPTGPQGTPGAGATMTIGSITTGAAGTNASATLSGTAPNYTLSLTIPRGAVGATGATGNTGATGAAGPANTLTIGTVNTLAAGNAATATITGSAPNQTLNLSIPQGPQGIQGPAGANGTNGTNGVGFPVGGATGTILTKNSGTDFDTSWVPSTASTTPSTHVIRDAAGRAQFADPSALADAATKNYVDTKDTAHANLTTTHGTTSTIVGISDTQTLTNKTISSPFIDKPKLTNYFDVGTAATPTAPGANTYRFNVTTAGIPTMQGPTGAPRQLSVQWPTTATTFVSTAAQGDTQYHSVYQCMFVYDGANWRQTSKVVIATATAFTTYQSALSGAGLTPHASFRVWVSDVGVEWAYSGSLWYPASGSRVSGKLWRTAGFSATIPNSDTQVAFNASRVTGGVSVSGASTLLLPIDGIYRLTARCYTSAGGFTGSAGWTIKRTRSGVSDVNIAFNIVFKGDSQDYMPTMTEDNVPLKAGDVLYLTMNNFSITNGCYWGTSEIAGVFLEAAWVNPLNGATPV